jgi:prephenate dehydrogenase
VGAAVAQGDFVTAKAKRVRKTVRRKGDTLAQAQLAAEIWEDLARRDKRKVVRDIAQFKGLLEDLIAAIESDDEKRMKKCIVRLVKMRMGK